MFTYGKLQELAKAMHMKEHDVVCEQLNNLKGGNIIEKFKSFLEAWDYHIRYDIEFSIDGKSIKVPITQIIELLPIENIQTVDCDDYSVVIGVPDKFYYGELDLIKNIKEFRYNGVSYFDNFDKLGPVLPAKIYNNLVNTIIAEDGNTLKFTNQILEDVSFNFMGTQVVTFMCGMIAGFSKEYFQDIMFALSKRVGADCVMMSDIRDIEYYIKKYNEEMDAESSNNVAL